MLLYEEFSFPIWNGFAFMVLVLNIGLATAAVITVNYLLTALGIMLSFGLFYLMLLRQRPLTISFAKRNAKGL
ncbi:MAG: hypothetical protein ACTHMI_14380 [Mucilaginibacter sp.]